MNISSAFSISTADIAIGHLVQPAPPSPLYRYRSDNSDFTLKEIEDPHIFFSRIGELNDPFEFKAPLGFNPAIVRNAYTEYCSTIKNIQKVDAEREFSNNEEAVMKKFLSAIEERILNSGVTSFSRNPNSIRMWSYYANKHQGICIGYNANSNPFLWARKINYQDPTTSIDPLEVFFSAPADNFPACIKIISDHISLRKAAEWEFEDEYRIVADRSGKLTIPIEAIESIRFGVNVKMEFRTKIFLALKKFAYRPQLIQMRCDAKKFILTENEITLP